MSFGLLQTEMSLQLLELSPTAAWFTCRSKKPNFLINAINYKRMTWE